MTATTPQGWVVIQSLRDQLAGRVDPCQVYACPPGDKDATAEVAWFGGVDSGSVEVPVLQDGRKQRNESVAGVLNVNIAGRSDLTSAQSRAIEVAAEFMDLFADDPTLGGLDGVYSSRSLRTRSTSSAPLMGRLRGLACSSPSTSVSTDRSTREAHLSRTA
jgi:hypothetical protein